MTWRWALAFKRRWSEAWAEATDAYLTARRADGLRGAA